VGWLAIYLLSNFVALEAIFLYDHLNTLLVLLFIFASPFLAAAFVPYKRGKLNCRLETVYTQLWIVLH